MSIAVPLIALAMLQLEQKQLAIDQIAQQLDFIKPIITRIIKVIASFTARFTVMTSEVTFVTATGDKGVK